MINGYLEMTEGERICAVFFHEESCGGSWDEFKKLKLTFFHNMPVDDFVKHQVSQCKAKNPDEAWRDKVYPILRRIYE